MLDRVDARFDRQLRGQVAVRMRRDLALPRVRLRHDRRELGRRELRHVDRIRFRKHAAGGADLDHVRPPLHLVAHGRAAFIRPVAHAFDRADWRDDVRRERALIAMAAGRADGVPGCDHARPDDHAFVDRVAQADVLPIAGADVAHGRESRFERPLRIQRRGVRLLDRKTQHLIVESLVVVLLELAIQMRVCVDEAWQQRRVAEIDDRRVCRHRTADRRDLVAVDHERAALRELARLAVEQIRRFQHDRRARCDLGSHSECRRDGGDDHRLQTHEWNLRNS